MIVPDGVEDLLFQISQDVDRPKHYTSSSFAALARFVRAEMGPAV